MDILAIVFCTFLVGLHFRKMASPTDKGAEAPFHKDTDLTTTIETKKEDFKKWRKENKEKCVDKQIITSPNYKIEIGKIGEGIVWNIYNLRCDQNAVFPNYQPTGAMKCGAKLWMDAFCSYTLDKIKNYALDQYVSLFNSPTWNILRGNTRLIYSFNEIVEKMKEMESEEV